MIPTIGIAILYVLLLWIFIKTGQQVYKDYKAEKNDKDKGPGSQMWR